MPPPMLSVNRRASLHEVGNRFNMASPQQRAKSASPSNTKRRIVPVTLNISADGYKPPAPASPPPSAKGKERESSSANGTPKGTPKVKPLANGHAMPKGTPNGTSNGRPKLANGTPNGNGSSKKALVNGHASTPKSLPNGTPNGASKGTPNGTPASGKKDKAKGSAKNAADALDLTWPQELKSRSAAGLANGSMSCYANATLQVIMHTPPVLRVALAHDREDCECPRELQGSALRLIRTGGRGYLRVSGRVSREARRGGGMLSVTNPRVARTHRRGHQTITSTNITRGHRRAVLGI